MAHRAPTSQSFVTLARGAKRLQLSDPLAPCLAPRLVRSYATVTVVPISQPQLDATLPEPMQSQGARLKIGTKNKSSSPFHTPVIATHYSWPSIQPSSYASYSYDHLGLPFRKDLLHRAVIYEADAARQGTASTKWRDSIRGSTKKKQPQKGMGKARQSDFKSPSVRGGGVAHGPHPRDFSTELPAQVYDLALRTALSLRYKKNELIVLEHSMLLEKGLGPRWIHNFFEAHHWGQGNGRTMVIMNDERQFRQQKLYEALEEVGEHAEVRSVAEVTVKDLLLCGRIVVDSPALKALLERTS